MDLSRAVEILKSLAENVDPFTGELLPENSICNRADVVRAFYRILFELGKQLDSEQTATHGPEKPTKPRPENAGKPWTEEDDETLIKMFDSGCSRGEIEAHFKRSSGGIASRLVRLGKIKDWDSF